MKKIITITILFLVSFFVCSQNTITGTFSGLKNQQIKLVGFADFGTYAIDSTKANDNG